MAETGDIKYQTPKERWNVLRTFIEDGKLCVHHRRTHSFGLFNSKKMANCRTPDGHNVETYEWLEYTSEDFPNCHVAIRERVRAVNWNDAVGFDNTGNICVWPSEEILSYLCIKNRQDFRGKTVCELGAGMSGLAGMMLAITSEVKEVFITDGNMDGVQNLTFIAKENEKTFGGTIVKTRVLRWDVKEDYAEYCGYFDFVMCADCLFYEQAHESLLHVMSTILKPEGTVFILSPRRGNTVERFIENGKNVFEIEEVEHYDDHVWSLYLKAKQSSPSLEAVKNFPIMLKLKRR